MEADECWFRSRAQWLALVPNDSEAEESLIKDLVTITRALGVIPEVHRSWVWPFFLTPMKRIEIASSQDDDITYQQLVDEDLSSSSSSPSPFLQKEIQRFTPPPWLENNTEKCYRILHALHNSNISYGHGQVPIATLLSSRYFDEESTYWALRTIIKYFVPEYYSRSITGFHTDCQVVNELLTSVNPSLALHLKYTCHFSFQQIGTSWLLPLFITPDIPEPITLIILDAFFAQRKSSVLLIAAVSLITLLEPDLASVSDTASVLQILSTNSKNIGEFKKKFLNVQQLIPEGMIEKLRNSEDGSSDVSINTTTATNTTNSIISTVLINSPALYYCKQPKTVFEESSSSSVWEFTLQNYKDDNDVSEIAALAFATGVPEHLRRCVWPILLGSQLKVLQQNSSSYAQLVKDALSSQKTITKEIEADVSRTSTSCESKLTRVLLGYSERNKAVGYCQGMNEVASLLLHILVDEELSFWSLSVILEVLCPTYHVGTSLIGLHTDCLVISRLVAERDSELQEHLQLLGVSMQLVCTSWLMTCFVSSLPINVSTLVLDMLFAYSSSSTDKCFIASKVLLGVSVSILLNLAREIKNLDCAGEVLELVSTYLKQLEDTNDCALITKARDVIKDIDSDDVIEFRKMHRTQVATEIAALEFTRQENIVTTTTNTATVAVPDSKARFSMVRRMWNSGKKLVAAKRGSSSSIMKVEKLEDEELEGDIIILIGEKLHQVSELLASGVITKDESIHMKGKLLLAAAAEDGSTNPSERSPSSIEKRSEEIIRLYRNQK